MEITYKERFVFLLDIINTHFHKVFSKTAGTESWYYFLRDTFGDEEYVRMINALEEHPEESYYSSLDEAVLKMGQERSGTD